MNLIRTLAACLVTLNCLLGLTGCAAVRFSSDEIDKAQAEAEYNRHARPVLTLTKPLLACIGNSMREAHVTPILVGWSVADTTGKTGVDQGLLVRSALIELGRTGSGVRATSMGVGPAAPGLVNGLSPEERLRQWRVTPRGPSLTEPDWVIEGGVTSVVNSAKAQQRGFGFDSRDATAARSRTRSFDEVRMSYAIKYWRDGVYIPGASWDGKVVYQQASASVDLGTYIAFSLNGRHHGAGVRGTASDAVVESAEDAIRVGVETAIAMMFADQYGVNLEACTGRADPLFAPDVKPGLKTSKGDLPDIYKAMSGTEATKWVQKELLALGYQPGAADGVHKPQTRNAILRYERDAGLSPDGRVSLPLFVTLARARLQAGAEMRPLAVDRDRKSDDIRIALSEPVGPYVVGQRLRAQVIAPQAGYIVCLFNSPDDGTVSIFPLIAGRQTFVSARTPLQLPSTNDGGPYPVITLSVAGTHAIYCAETRADITRRLPAPLRPGADGRRVDFAQARSTLRQVAGSDWIADGQATFAVVKSGKR